MADWGTRALVFYLDSNDFSDAVSNVQVASAESGADFLSFASAAAGGARDYTLQLTMTQNNATTALWYYLWNDAGSDFTYEVWPNGRPVSGTPSVTQPKFSGTVSVREPDGTIIGGEADASVTQRFTTDVEWPLTAKPTMTTS